ncbi:hypothetical protein SDC9_204768 [bioreactor metagenome]|uniref:Uncharacterized protein n=1 Tax=bioreactor metagenome TaxID=1076179 RepID=A0A645J9B5_9ZZZZ
MRAPLHPTDVLIRHATTSRSIYIISRMRRRPLVTPRRSAVFRCWAAAFLFAGNRTPGFSFERLLCAFCGLLLRVRAGDASRKIGVFDGDAVAIPGEDRRIGSDVPGPSFSHWKDSFPMRGAYSLAALKMLCAVRGSDGREGPYEFIPWVGKGLCRKYVLSVCFRPVCE